MKVRALIQFDDYKEGVRREVGDDFIVSKDRYQEILEKGGNWVAPLDNEGNIIVETEVTGDADISNSESTVGTEDNKEC